MLQSHDEVALEALASKGLLRRAQRDLASGQGQVKDADANQALILVDGQTVTVHSKGPASSNCTCKAQGVCRHLLFAILLLRERLRDSADAKETSAPVSVLKEVCALSEAQVRKFAGADWAKAVALVDDDLEIEIEEQGANVTVRLAELNAAITMIAGNGLKGAAYKGPKTKQRLLVTLATLAIRRREGIADAAQAEARSAGVTTTFIDQAQQTIEQAVLATLPSRSALAHDLLLDLAISSRCEALPRLSAELRALAKQSQRAGTRSVDFEPETFLLAASRSYALLETLRTKDNDPTLIGSVRRNYKSTDALDVWPLAVSRWRSDTGARGLSAYLLDVTGNRWLTVLEGRSSGADAGFNIGDAYNMPIWGVGTLSGVMGQQVHLPQPNMTQDGLLTSKQSTNAQLKPFKTDAILQSTSVCRDWQLLKRDLAARMGSGIYRRLTPVPALIAPTGFGRISFDDVNQSYRWEVHDQLGESLILRMPAEQEDSAIRLWQQGKKILAIVIEAQLDRLGLALRPVSVLLQRGNRIDLHNVDFDQWPVERGIRKAFSNFKERVAIPLDPVESGSDQIGLAVANAAEELVSVLGGSTSASVASIRRVLEGSGLATLGDALQSVSGSQDIAAVLRAAYLISELEALRVLGADVEGLQ